jgi:hypothetical protein
MWSCISKVLFTVNVYIYVVCLHFRVFATFFLGHEAVFRNGLCTD